MDQADNIGAAASNGLKDDLRDGDHGADDLGGGRSRDGDTGGRTLGLNARNSDGGLELNGGDWDGVDRSRSDGEGGGICDDGWVLWDVRSADTLEEVLSLANFLIIGAISRQALVDDLDKVGGLAEAVGVSVGLAL